MKKFYLLFIAAILLGSAQAQTSIMNDSVRYLCSRYHIPASRDLGIPIDRSDSIDIIHFVIRLDVTAIDSKKISGNCEVQFKSRVPNINTIFLDLLKMHIDSVKQNGQPVSFSYNDSATINITLLNTLQAGDSAAVTVYYNGNPQADEQTFGGFYFRNGYAYNLGVGPAFYPHSTGRTWYPCFDNFFERATYEFYVLSNAGNMAVCNGTLQDSVQTSDTTTTWHWKLSNTIPSYLANVAVGSYAAVHLTLNGINGPVPTQLVSAPADTTRVKNSFIHLPDAFRIFEEKYGPYQWERMGFVMVPFSNIAMEHATNVTYPITSAPGNTSREHLMVHELAHQWFGNQVTPKTVEDYWLKEGWAVYSENVFYENYYGRKRFLDEVAINHETALRVAHIFDNGYLAQSPVPQQYTYGQTVYSKGGDMAHTLRAYLGDSLLFTCLQNFLSDNAYTGQDSYEFRDYMQNCSGIDLTDFFDDWIFAPGFPHFSIDSFEVQARDSVYDVAVHIRQRLNHAPHYYKNVPLEVTFMNADRESITRKINISGPCLTYKTTLPFNPVFACTDLNERLSDAITENYDTLGRRGGFNFTFAKMNVVVTGIVDTAFLRIEHNFIPPDPMKNPIPGLHLSQERYWRVDGIFPDSFAARGVIAYNGSLPLAPTTFSNFYLDYKLITNSEDSLELMYRPSVDADWEIVTDRIRITGGIATDKTGEFTINRLKKGEYALAIWQYDKVDSTITPTVDTCITLTSITDVVNEAINLLVYPNPSSNSFTLEGILPGNSEIEIFNLQGQRIWYSQLPQGYLLQQVQTAGWGNGVYVLRLSGEKERYLASKKIVIVNNR